MTSLKSVLTEVQDSWAEAGAGIGLHKALIVHRRREFRLLVAFGIAMALCIVVAAWLLATRGTSTARAFGGYAGLGGGGGALVLFLKAWTDWRRTDLLLILLDDATKTQIASMITRLIAKI